MKPAPSQPVQAEPTDAAIMAIAGQWFVTGENLRKPDGYYYRSLGTPSNVRGSDLIEFARALYTAPPARDPKWIEEAMRLVGLIRNSAFAGEREATNAAIAALRKHLETA